MRSSRRDDAGYDEARKVYNAMIDRRPSVVVRCTSTDDVVAAVNYARENELAWQFAAAVTASPASAPADDAVVVDLAGMTDVQVDPEKRTARAQGGATWGNFNDATHAHGLATTGGIISTTGVGGLTLGGGIGYLARGFGLSCDNLVSAEVVTADGQVLVGERRGERGSLLGASRRRRELRRRHVVRVPAPPRQGHLRRADVLRDRGRRRPCCASTASSSRTRPEEFGGFPAWQIAPPLPFIPEDRHGEPFMAFVACWAGPVDAG